MSPILNDLRSEIIRFVSGKTLEALFPPILFLVLVRIMPLLMAGALTLALSGLILAYRLSKRTSYVYAIAGFIGVIIAILFSALSGSSKGYFLPSILSSLIFMVACLASLIIGKPLAAWLSHLTRGWPTDWFWRDDIRPAYTEVTLMWAVFLTLRFTILIRLYVLGNVGTVFLTNTLLGTPATFLVLSLSYIYGIIRLRRLKGPSVEEHINRRPKPWTGQRTGF